MSDMVSVIKDKAEFISGSKKFHERSEIFVWAWVKGNITVTIF